MASGERLELTCLSFWYTARAACWGLWEHARVSCLLSSASGRALLKYYVCAVHAHTDERRAHRTGHSHLPHAQSPRTEPAHTFRLCGVRRQILEQFSRKCLFTAHSSQGSLSLVVSRARARLSAVRKMLLWQCVCVTVRCAEGAKGVSCGVVGHAAPRRAGHPTSLEDFLVHARNFVLNL